MEFANESDRLFIDKIVTRYRKESAKRGYKSIRADQLACSLSACHANGCALNLPGLLDSRVIDLFHDVGGIHDTVSRETGKIVGQFWPRFAVQQ